MMDVFLEIDWVVASGRRSSVCSVAGTGQSEAPAWGNKQLVEAFYTSDDS